MQWYFSIKAGLVLAQSIVWIAFLKTKFRSFIQCASICISTLGCSAFKFDEKSGSCDLGSKLKLQLSPSSNSQQQLTKISVNTADGINLNI
jgi:hypothetical protein